MPLEEIFHTAGVGSERRRKKKEKKRAKANTLLSYSTFNALNKMVITRAIIDIQLKKIC